MAWTLNGDGTYTYSGSTVGDTATALVGNANALHNLILNPPNLDQVLSAGNTSSQVLSVGQLWLGNAGPHLTADTNGGGDVGIALQFTNRGGTSNVIKIHGDNGLFSTTATVDATGVSSLILGGSLYTPNNTLDDGSGNMRVGSLVVGETITFAGGVGAIGSYGAGGIQFYNYGGQILTANSTLDNGYGDMVVGNLLSVNCITMGSNLWQINASGSTLSIANNYYYPVPALTFTDVSTNVSVTSITTGGGTTLDDGSGNMSVIGTVSATSYSGVGTSLTALNGSNISSGTVANARTTAVSTATASTIALRDTNGNLIANNHGTTQQSLSDSSGTIAWNAASGGNATTTLSGTGRTLSNPTNLVTGASYQLIIKQDATGSRTITTWGTVYKFPNGVKPVLSTAASAIDVLSFYFDGTNLYGVAQKAFA